MKKILINESELALMKAHPPQKMTEEEFLTHLDETFEVVNHYPAHVITHMWFGHSAFVADKSSTERRIMQTQWKELEEFPDYAVSEFGEVVNIKSGYERKLSINQQGLVKVSLYDWNGKLRTRSVARLVAESFVLRPDNDQFDTPIHRDGQATNCRADNLFWRPRWFAIKYHKQFHFPTFHVEGNGIRVFMDVETEETYPSVKDVCIANGLYFHDVIKSVVEGVRVFPTWQSFIEIDG